MQFATELLQHFIVYFTANKHSFEQTASTFTAARLAIRAAAVLSTAVVASMEDLSSKVGIERLDLDNYSSWVVRVKCLLVSKGLWKPTQETSADPWPPSA